MKDYWKDLSLREAWSKRERFNFILNHIDEKLGESPTDNPSNPSSNPSEDEPTVIAADINVSVKDSEGNGIGGASVTVSQEGNNDAYSSSTGSAGGCTIKDVPLGDYVITTEATGYISSVDDYTVTANENIFEVILEDEVDDDV